jgi:hypothetical protein
MHGMNAVTAFIAELPRLPVRLASRKRIAAPILGLLAATGFEPLGLWPLALLAMGGFVLLLGQVEARREAFILGWLFGIAHFTFANNWIATAFTYQAEMPAFLGWIAVPLLSLYLALYPALAALCARGLSCRGEGAGCSQSASQAAGSSANGCAPGSSPVMRGIPSAWCCWAGSRGPDLPRWCPCWGPMPCRAWRFC